MQQDDHFHDAESPGVPYTYSTHDGQLRHVIANTSNYYGMGRLIGMESPLPTRYPESAPRGMMEAAQYSAAYNTPSTFQPETYRLSEPLPTDGSFDNNFVAPGPSHSHIAARNTHPFSAMSQHADAGSLTNTETNFYEPITSHPTEMIHTYPQSISLTSHALQRHNVPSDYKHFGYARTSNDAFIPASLPSLGTTAGRVAGNSPAQQLKHRPFDEMPEFEPPRGVSIDQKLFQNPSINEADNSDRPDKPMGLQRHFPASQRPVTSRDRATASQPDDSVSPPAAVAKKKKSKMHDCEICRKQFPRPSGLRTHMNIHNNVKPYPCSFPGCTRSFAVRSNAKRHLRTHGIIPSTAATSSSLASPSAAPYLVGFATPTVAQAPEGAESHQVRRAPFELKWMPPSLSTRTNAERLRSISDVEESEVEEDDDDYEELPRTAAFSKKEETIGFHAERGEGSSQSLIGELNRSARSALSIPLRAVVPTSPLPPTPRCSTWNISTSMCGTDFGCYARYEERNSFREAGSYPYHPSQFRALPGPAMLCPSLTV